jgi:DNA-binding response OmpR family regulator
MTGRRTSLDGKRAQARGSTYPSRRILVVDDDMAVRELSTLVLSNCGYKVDAAEDGAEGWEALHANNYDLLITDQNMPRVSGIELVKKLRSAFMTLPVVMASSSIPTEALNKDPSLQVAAMLLKPFTCDELLDTVNQVLHTTDGAREQTKPLPTWRSQPSSEGLWL